MEVKDPPQGVTPPTQNTPKKMGHQPNKVSSFDVLCWRILNHQQKPSG